MPDIFIAEPKETAAAPNEPTPLINAEETLPPQNPVRLFSALKKDPDGIDFQDKEDDEKIILFIRRSFITNVRWLFFGSLLLILPLFLPFILKFFPNPLLFLPSKFYFFLSAFYYLLVVAYWYVNFISWYFNISLVTDKRVIAIEFSNLVYKDVAATK